MGGKSRNNILRLFDESLTSYYWLGFFIGDGSLSERGQFKLWLSQKDEAHLRSFASYIGYTGTIGTHVRDGKYPSVGLQVMDTSAAKKFRSVFGLHHRKTYHPCDFSSVPVGDKLFSLIVGYFDADASIHNLHNRSDVALSMKGHSSWESVFCYFVNHLNSYEWDVRPTPRPRINGQGYAQIDIGNNAILSAMKKKIIELELPALGRKWHKVPTEFNGRYQKARERLTEIKRLLAAGKRNKEIAHLLGISPAAVTITMKRNNLRYGHIL